MLAFSLLGRAEGWSNNYRFSWSLSKNNDTACQSKAKFYEAATRRTKTVLPEGGRSTFRLKVSLRECVTGQAVTFSIDQGAESLWTAKILQHFKFGQGRQALQAYDEMQMHGVNPSSYTVLAALKACSALKDLASAKQIYADVVETGLQSNLYVANMLLHVFAICGSMLDARCAFEQMAQCNVVSWTTMITGYAQTEEYEEALRLYGRMQEKGFPPNERTFLGALKACSRMAASQEESGPDGQRVTNRCLEQVRIIHSDIMTGRFDGDVFVGSMLVDVYAKCGRLVDARRVFENMPHHNVVSWTAMIFGYAQGEEGEEALRLYASMRHKGVEPNDRTFVAALKACSSLAALERIPASARMPVKTKSLELVRAIHSDVVKSGYAASVFVGNILVDAYSKCGSLVDASIVFEKMHQRNVVSWTCMIQGCAQLRGGEEALELYKQMQQQGVQPNAQTFVAVLRACSSLALSEEGNAAERVLVKRRCLEQVRAIHAQVIKSERRLVATVENSLMDAYAKCGCLPDARHLFEKMPSHSVVSWTVMIFGYAEAGEGEVALDLYGRMQQEGVVPDDRTFIAALKACGSIAALKRGKDIHFQIVKAGLYENDVFVASSLIDMYGKCGSMVDAQQVFDRLYTTDIVIWNSLIAGYARLGESAVVFNLVDAMKREAIQPDIITVLSLLTVCGYAGLVDKGQKLFEAIGGVLGITPTIEHYTCMVNVLGRSGNLDKAMSLAQSMPHQPDCVVWRTLLSSCQKWYLSGR